MNKQKSKTNKTKKRISTIIAILAILALLLTGTYAWVDYSQHRTNTFDNTNSKTYDIYLVEDFAPIHNWTTADAPKLKNISVMNKGEAPEFGAGYVRLSLKEYFEFSEKTYTYSDNWYALDNNGDYIYIDKNLSEADAILEAEALGYYNGVGYETDYTSGVEGWFAIAGEYHINGQYGKHMITGIENSTPDSLAPGVERADYEETENHKLSPTGECAYTPHDWTGVDQFGFRDYVKWNLGENVISLTEWATKSETDKDAFEGWIYDDRTTSGYVYWSQPLEPQKNTSKLLETVELINQPSGDFYYALHVDMETLSLDELAKEVYEWQDAPETVIEYWLGKERDEIATPDEAEEENEEFFSIAAGYEHIIALKSDGTVWAWGSAGGGRLGNGTTEDNYTPTRVLGENGEGFLTDVKAVSAGEGYSLALKKEGTVWAWGANGSGELGIGKDNDDYDYEAIEIYPVQVVGKDGEGYLTGVKAIDSHVCYHYVNSIALKEDGTVWTWGHNGSGGLGIGNQDNKNTPTQVVGEDGIGFLENVIAVAAGENIMAALKNDGTVWTWGAGALGNGEENASSTPVQVVGENGEGFLKDIKAIDVGAFYFVALKNDGTVLTWGYNDYGCLGIGVGSQTQSKSLVPIHVVDESGSETLSNVKNIAAGNHHILALKEDCTLLAWGNNSNGQLGNGTISHIDAYVPERVSINLDNIVAIGANEYSVVLTEDNSVWAWGRNFGQLGDGTREDNGTPTQVIFP